MPNFSEPGATLIFVVTIAASLLGLYRAPQLIEVCLFRPYYFLRRQQYHTVVSSGFVHADLGHLLFNMFTFYFFAFPMERLFGTQYFLALYLFGLLISHGCTYFKQRDNSLYASLGASGAISAVLFAYIVYFPTTTLFIFPIPVPIPAALFAVGYVAYSYWAAARERGRINHDAHLCGALSGLVYVLMVHPQAYRLLFETLF
ncbi:MAG: rhomboid family intramembrane serine protease [Gammaproteobacteria bacterium]|nr:rhomboid family intramembrane serine protease [Gammaproteobacteria bacterium]MDH4313361.1 rhomboid family intramembrane serine protease [Gammaproteobacteria bacterium]MDH5213727.1 rhomboid family intramembrane serine protease [Gammaproteobacteria bacterium]MDH5500980.1 rhomboid family intramembrane serine protease [Gammaproteobacteria bacterium]